MKHIIIRIAYIFFSLTLMTVAAKALPPIIIYNPVAPIPAFELVSLSPQNHQSFNVSPGVVKVAFTEAIDGTRSAVKVYDPYNNIISAPVISQDTSMTVTLPPHQLAGAYRIEWNATCACSAHTAISGTSYFTVY